MRHLKPGNKRIAVIMAGGMGERFWPITSPEHPKYALKFNRKKTLISATYERLRLLYPAQCIYVITVEAHRELVLRLLPGISKNRILAEPERKNTAAALTYATLMLKKSFGEDALLSFFPADAMIKNSSKFVNTMRSVLSFARESGLVSVIGVRPDYPSTGFGYIEMGKPLKKPWNKGWEVCRFTEKPTLIKAKSFIRKRRHLWNAGIFTWTITSFERAMDCYAPSFYKPFKKIFSSGRFEQAKLRKLFRKIHPEPIDRVLMERMRPSAVFEASFDWDDIGSWEALRRLFGDSNGNFVAAEGFLEDVKNSVIVSDGKTRITASGVQNTVIAAKDAQILVSNVEDSQKIPYLRRLTLKK